MGVVEIYIVEELVVIPMGVALLVDMAVRDDPYAQSSGGAGDTYGAVDRSILW